MATLLDYLKVMAGKKASELRLAAGAPPQLLTGGGIVPASATPLDETETRKLSFSLFTDDQKLRFETDGRVEVPFGIKDLGRFMACIEKSPQGGVTCVVKSFNASAPKA